MESESHPRLNIEVLESDPAPTFIVKDEQTAPGVELLFCNQAFRKRKLDDGIHAQGKAALLFRSWIQACGHFKLRYEFLGWVWTADKVGINSTWKIVKAIECTTKEGGPVEDCISDSGKQAGVNPYAANSNRIYKQSKDESQGDTEGNKTFTVPTIPRTNLRARWESIQTMMEMSDVGVFEYKPSGELIHANEAWYRLSSHPRTVPEHVDFSFMDLVYPDDQPLVMSMWNTLAQGNPVTFEMRWKGRPGSKEPVQWVLSACVPVFDDEKNLVGIAGNTIDIMAQKESQEAAQARVEALEQARLSELKFARFAQLSPIAIYIFIPQTGIEYVNDHFFELTAYSSASLNKFEWSTIVADEDVNEVEINWAKILESRVSDGIQFRLKKTWVNQDGICSNIWVQSSNYPELDADGNIISIMGTLFDISQFKWAEAVQQQRTEEALESKRQQENFIDMTSHELRNPLSAVVQCADSVINTLQAMVIEPHGASAAKIDPCMYSEDISVSIDSLHTIVSCSLHQKRVIDDVLTLSKLDSSLITISPIRVQPTVVVSEALKIFDVECNQMDIRLLFRRDASLETYDWVMLDPSRLLQVLINLLTNAIKFTKECPTRNITITLGASSTRPENLWDFVQFTQEDDSTADLLDGLEWGDGERTFLWLKVEDTGCGMTIEEQKKLFSRFSQATPRTHVKYGGSGLGLFISKTLAKLQGGAIGVTSQAAVGSTFVFYISSRTAHPPIGWSPHTHPGLQRNQSTDAAMRATKLSVLIVEDNLVNQKVLKKQLQMYGWDVSIAGDGEQALEWLKNSVYWHGTPRWVENGKAEEIERNKIDVRRHELDIILMDIEMPVMDGLTCARTIRMYEQQGLLGPPSHRNDQSERLIRQHTISSISPISSFGKPSLFTRRQSIHGFRLPILAVSANARMEQVDHSLAAGMDDSISKPFRVPELWPKILQLVKRLS